MPIQRREFRGEADLQAMTALGQTHPEGWIHIADLPYRLSSWALDAPENIGLWEDEHGRLLAWGLLNTPFWTMDFKLLPAAPPELLRRVLDWLDERAAKTVNTPAGHECWFIAMPARQQLTCRELEAAGFASQANLGEDSWCKVFLSRDPALPVGPYPAPAGFTVRPLQGEAEAAAYVALHQTVFETKNMTTAWRARTLQRPEYRPELDIVVEAPDGRLAAFCIGWLTPGNIGQIEPLGCLGEFRRAALGRVALAEVLRRLIAAGAAAIYVETDTHRNTAFGLYRFMDFEVVDDVIVYRKNYA
ncbi:MAG TPA: GNAT family N-acetyltransferase [Anaerolineaceae bacterium]|jgi:ribosomal protein S18 acetylase RimI-like enzyme|nr:GNAT family N-acetyltransferase [Anaerolineaceae bacterium]